MIAPSAAVREDNPIVMCLALKPVKVRGRSDRQERPDSRKRAAVTGDMRPTGTPWNISSVRDRNLSMPGSMPVTNFTMTRRENKTTASSMPLTNRRTGLSSRALTWRSKAPPRARKARAVLGAMGM